MLEFPCPPPGDLSDPGINPVSPETPGSPAVGGKVRVIGNMEALEEEKERRNRKRGR